MIICSVITSDQSGLAKPESAEADLNRNAATYFNRKGDQISQLVSAMSKNEEFNFPSAVSVLYGQIDEESNIPIVSL